jgi:hypothetical protein
MRVSGELPSGGGGSTASVYTTSSVKRSSRPERLVLGQSVKLVEPGATRPREVSRSRNAAAIASSGLGAGTP